MRPSGSHGRAISLTSKNVAHVSHKLSGSVEGALAGGGDPATSPLYVFGPFLRMIFAAGVASVVFGAAVWLAVLTVIMVSAMYRLVMIWVTDGSGGSGLSEEEFGGWAVIVNAGITVVEYTLTFLVSIAALVTFMADRLPVLGESILGLPLRTFMAVGCSLLVGFAVNMGPKVAARAFGPATAAVLLLLWAMIVATIWQYGLRFPPLDWSAFSTENLHITLGGYARILALMTGIEIFANLVAAYQGPARERSRKAFGSLIIIMGTTSLTMLIVGPAIYDLADVQHHEVSVFTQTMDKLLPAPLPYLGTLIGIAVLLSAAAAAAQGIQNLSLGLRYRHYIPPWLGQRNKYDVAANPVWLVVGVCAACFVVFGTLEETYLALYAAGVFVLLSLTAWATVKRLGREARVKATVAGVAALVGTVIAAFLSSGATFIIFEERFTEGAWVYLLIIPVMYVMFRHFRKRLGPPRSIDNRLGLSLASSNLPPVVGDALYSGIAYENILVPLDQTPAAELALAQAQTLARNYTGTIHLLTVVGEAPNSVEVRKGRSKQGALKYLQDVAEDLSVGGYRWDTSVRDGAPADEIGRVATDGGMDIVILSSRSHSRLSRWVLSHVTLEVIHQTTPPLLLIRPTDAWYSTRTRFQRLLVPLDGSATAEQVFPHVRELALKFRSEVRLLSVPEGSESDDHADKLQAYLDRIGDSLIARGIPTRTMLAQGDPVEAILRTTEELRCDLIMMVSHGRGGVERRVKLGSTVEDVIERAPCPVFMVSAEPETAAAAAGEDEAGEPETRAAEPEDEAEEAEAEAAEEPSR